MTQTHVGPAPTEAVQDAADAMAPAGPQVWDAMTVEVALSLMTAVRTRHLVICDEDGRRTGHVTLARLAAVRDGADYTDRVRLCDVDEDPYSGAGSAGHHRTSPNPPPAEEEDGARRALAVSR